jgi:flagellum-specific ATP synthase
MTAAAEAPRNLPSLAAQRGGGRLDRLVLAVSAAAKHQALVRIGGYVEEVSASHVKVGGLARRVGLGSCVEIETGSDRCLGEVIGIQQQSVTIKLFAAAPRVGLGSRVWLRDELVVRPDLSWVGRTVNALGQPIDGNGDLGVGDEAYPIDGEPLAPLALDRIRNPCTTGVRAIDLFTPICIGQRIGVFAGSGVGKSTLISMLTRSSGFKVVVVALVAERAREVREFIEDVIRPSGAKAVTVVATSSESAMMRKLSAKTAMTIAEYFRDRGDDVLLVVDSVTRYAHAMREIALAAGEPPVARGYAPSVFAELPRLLERAGPGTPATGSITGVFSVLVDGDDHNDPVADTVRGILDGHIVLDRSIADQGRYPAINPLSSISRLAGLAWTKEEAVLVRRLRALIARYEDTRELRTLGAYKPGADPELDQAVVVVPIIYRHLSQSPEDPVSRKPFDELAAALSALQATESAREVERPQQRQQRVPPPPPTPPARA